MFESQNDQGFRNVLPGILQKTLVYGDRTLMTEFRLSRGCKIPHHAHPHEQTGYLISGRIRLSIDDHIHEATPGDSWAIPENTSHGAECLEDAVVIEVFSPVRDDYLPSE